MLDEAVRYISFYKYKPGHSSLWYMSPHHKYSKFNRVA